MDDLRESSIVSLVRDLWHDGIDVLVHDSDVNPNELLGSNLAYLERQLPQINKMLCPRVEDMINQSEVIVVAQKRAEFLDVLMKYRRRVVVLDLVRISDQPESLGFAKYLGVSW